MVSEFTRAAIARPLAIITARSKENSASRCVKLGQRTRSSTGFNHKQRLARDRVSSHLGTRLRRSPVDSSPTRFNYEQVKMAEVESFQGDLERWRALALAFARRVAV